MAFLRAGDYDNLVLFALLLAYITANWLKKPNQN